MGSSSSALVEASTSDDSLEDLKCINCKELLTVLPITWYLNRGNVCGRCPEIQHNDGYKNMALEAMIKLQKLPCRYKKNNCSQTMGYQEVKKHEETCTYRQYSCPTIPITCPWKGKRSEMKKHYEERHETFLMTENLFSCFYLDDNFEQNIFVQAMKKQFLVQMRYEKVSSILRCGLIYLENPSENKQYVFAIKFYNGDSEFSRKVKNSRFIETYLLGKDELYEINFKQIELLINDSRTMYYQITVTEEDSN